MDKNDIKNIKDLTAEFFRKMTIGVSDIGAEFFSVENEQKTSKDDAKNISEVVKLKITTEEPQILIGEGGQTLSEIQRILRLLLNKKLQKFFYLNFDINNYREKKTDYLKKMVKDLADEVAITKEEKRLFPMPSYERRIIHSELSQRSDIITESRGDGPDRHIVIKPR